MLTISTVNYRNWQATVECVRQVAAACAGLEFRILIRDNSEETQLELIRSDLANTSFDVHCYPSPDNPGFGGGHNRNFQEVAHQQDDQFLILNSDICLSDSDSIRAMMAVGRTDRIVSCVVCCSKTRQVWFAGGKIDGATGDLAVRRDEIDGVLRGTDFISGCCMMVPARMFEDLDGFNESLFMYAEDLEFCLRAKAAGAELVVVNRSILHNIGSGYEGGYSDLYLYENTKNRLHTLRRHKLGLPVLRDVYFVAKYGLARTAQLMLYSRSFSRQVSMVWRGILDGYRVGSSPALGREQ